MEILRLRIWEGIKLCIYAALHILQRDLISYLDKLHKLMIFKKKPHLFDTLKTSEFLDICVTLLRSNN